MRSSTPLLLALGLLVVNAPARAEPPSLVVGTRPLPPFVIQNADGGWSGISIDLWKRVADELKLPYTIRRFETPQLLEPEKNGIDVVVSVNVSARNEAYMDVTHAFFSTGLAIATRAEPRSGVGSIARKMLSLTFLRNVGIVALVLLLMGILMWRIERKTTPDEFGGTAARGIAGGVFWAFESLVSKGRALSKSRLTRLVTLGWSLLCVMLVSGVTAKLSAELTINQLSTTVTGPNDLPKVRVGTVVPSLSAQYLERRGVHAVAYADIDQALAGLERGDVAALVYEAPILQYHASQRAARRVVVLPGTFHNHGYGFGLRSGSDGALRESINRTLLQLAESDEWKKVLARYLGGTYD